MIELLNSSTHAIFEFQSFKGMLNNLNGHVRTKQHAYEEVTKEI